MLPNKKISLGVAAAVLRDIPINKTNVAIATGVGFTLITIKI
jgi:hypothetical protein